MQNLVRYVKHLVKYESTEVCVVLTQFLPYVLI